MINAFFQQFDLFTPEEIKSITSLFEKQKMPKNGYFVKEGDECSKIAFVEQGIFRSFYVDQQGKEHTYCFRFPNELIGPYSAFITGNKSIENMQAIIPSIVWTIEKCTLIQLGQQYPQWDKFLKIIAEQQYLELEGRIIQLQRESAAQRYQNLLLHYPSYIREIPLQYIASYLNITQRHLSRLRKTL
ncbi:MAG: Crp/Fnr family transcriptional regulator [Flavobacteriaceae bacterium]|jgi:CRP-like cAMP-binding protein|nr:Crp/Fnr family transcriptional regulator [Flavobacteriaceae bacterium]